MNARTGYGDTCSVTPAREGCPRPGDAAATPSPKATGTATHAHDVLRYHVPTLRDADEPGLGHEIAALVDRCRTGDSDAYAALYRRWFPRCRTVALKVLAGVGAEDEADDVAQEALVLAWARLDQLRDSASFGSWVSRITYNVALGSVRRHRPDTEPLEALSDEHEALVTEDADPQDVVVGRERDRLVRVAAGSLAGREEEVFERVVDDGMTPAEVARALNVSDNHAYQILFRLRGRMQSGMRAALVWRQGRPRCRELARIIGDRRTPTAEAFTPQTANLIVRHMRRCPSCAQEADVHAGPHHLLSGVMAGLLVRMPSWLVRSRAADTVVAATAGDVTVKVAACVGIATSITAGVVTFTGLPDARPQAPRPGTRVEAVDGIRGLPAGGGDPARGVGARGVAASGAPCPGTRSWAGRDTGVRVVPLAVRAPADVRAISDMPAPVTAPTHIPSGPTSADQGRSRPAPSSPGLAQPALSGPCDDLAENVPGRTAPALDQPGARPGWPSAVADAPPVVLPPSMAVTGMTRPEASSVPRRTTADAGTAGPGDGERPSMPSSRGLPASAAPVAPDPAPPAGQPAAHLERSVRVESGR